MNWKQEARRFDRGTAWVGSVVGAPRLGWDWNPIHAVENVAGKVKDGVVGVGHAVGKVASNPIVEGLGGMALGSGLGTALGVAGGALKPGGGLKGAVDGAKQGYVAGVAGQALGGALGAGITAIPTIGPALVKYAAAHGLDPKALLDKIPSIGSALDAVKGNGGQNALGLGLGAYAAAMGKKSSDYADNAMGSTQANWDERAPLRATGQAALLNPGAGIAPKLAGIPNRNPYSASPPTLGPATVGPAVSRAV